MKMKLDRVSRGRVTIPNSATRQYDDSDGVFYAFYPKNGKYLRVSSNEPEINRIDSKRPMGVYMMDNHDNIRITGTVLDAMTRNKSLTLQCESGHMTLKPQ